MKPKITGAQLCRHMNTLLNSRDEEMKWGALCILTHFLNEYGWPKVIVGNERRILAKRAYRVLKKNRIGEAQGNRKLHINGIKVLLDSLNRKEQVNAVMAYINML